MRGRSLGWFGTRVRLQSRPKVKSEKLPVPARTPWNLGVFDQELAAVFKHPKLENGGGEP